MEEGSVAGAREGGGGKWSRCPRESWRYEQLSERVEEVSGSGVERVEVVSRTDVREGRSIGRVGLYGAVRESHNERTRNTLKHYTCSHK